MTTSSAPSTPPLAPALAQAWQRGRRVFVICSDEDLLSQEAADALRRHWRSEGYGDRQVFVVSGANFKWGPVLDSGPALSLFAQKQWLELRIANGKPGREGSEALQTLLRFHPDGGDRALLLLLPRADGEMKKSAWFKALQAVAAILELPNVERQHLPRWIAERLAQQGQSCEPGADGERSMQWLCDRLEGHLLAAHQEILKLGLLYPPGTLSWEQISASVASVARYDVFKLSEAVWSGQLLRTERMLAGLRAEGEAEVLVHWVLADDVLKLYRLRQGLDAGQNLGMLSRELRLFGPKQALLERLASRISLAQATELLHAASQVDAIVKGLPQKNWPSTGWAAIGRLAWQMSMVAKP